ncbi:hypothetical protein BGZ95_006535, partial [Linnemannia exigua]
KPKAKRQHSANADWNRSQEQDHGMTPTIDLASVSNQDTIATAFKSIAASPASGARAPSIPSSTTPIEAVPGAPTSKPITSAATADSGNIVSSGTGVQFYTLQDGNFYNTGGFNPPAYPDKTGNTILACRHHWPAKGHKLCHGSDAIRFKCRLCLGLPLDNGVQSWNGRCLSWLLEAPDPLPETDCCPMIRNVRRTRLIYNLFPDGEIPADFVEAWRHWAAAYQPEPPSPHRSSIDNGESSLRAPVRARQASTEDIFDMEDCDDMVDNGGEQSHVDSLYRSRSDSKGKGKGKKKYVESDIEEESNEEDEESKGSCREKDSDSSENETEKKKNMKRKKVDDTDEEEEVLLRKKNYKIKEEKVSDNHQLKDNVSSVRHAMEQIIPEEHHIFAREFNDFDYAHEESDEYDDTDLIDNENDGLHANSHTDALPEAACHKS